MTIAMLGKRTVMILVWLSACIAVGASALAQTQTATPNLYRSLESESGARPAKEIRGRIESVDYPGGTLIVRHGANRTVVAVVPATTIYRRGGYATLADLRRGENVDISVYMVGGRLVAQTIRI